MNIGLSQKMRRNGAGEAFHLGGSDLEGRALETGDRSHPPRTHFVWALYDQRRTSTHPWWEGTKRTILDCRAWTRDARFVGMKEEVNRPSSAGLHT